MNSSMWLADDTQSDLALVALLLAFSGVLVLAALGLAAWLRVDRAVAAVPQDKGASLKNAIALVMGTGSVALLMGALPTNLLVQPTVATLAAAWICGSTVAIAVAAGARNRPAASGKAQALQGDIRKAA
jgi:hypothetical protein